jgi:hypothetical protein
MTVQPRKLQALIPETFARIFSERRTLRDDVAAPGAEIARYFAVCNAYAW